MKARKLKAAVVHWLDAYECEEHEHDADGLLQVSAGILVSKNRKAIKLAKIADVYQSGDPFRDVLTIPAALVKSIVVVDVPPPPGGKKCNTNLGKNSTPPPNDSAPSS